MSAQQLPLGTSKILATVENGIGWLTINNPEQRNAISMEMRQGITDAIQAFESQDEVRVVILRGAGGRSFASGADISEFEKTRGNAKQNKSAGTIAEGTLGLADFSKPLIAMIEGYCIGGGLVLALAADIRFAAAGSVFGIPAAKLGLGYPYEGVAALARVVGPAVARDVLFSARKIGSDEAIRLGLVNFVVDAKDLELQVRSYAEQVASNAPLTIRAAKAAARAYERHTVQQEAASIAALVDRCFDSEDFKEGRRAFLEKRRPGFQGR